MGVPRFLPDVSLPPYTHVPGRTPHPISDPGGHSFGHVPERPVTPDPDRWHNCRMYLRGLDLFNHGYYWEAHEVWESLWHACGRRGRTADFLKGLIKLAAAGVKVREGQRRGVVDHARGAAALFRRIGRPEERLFGLRLGELLNIAEAVAANPATSGEWAAPIEIVFSVPLRPEST
jgi:predicted metal-dependent hydrolase